MSKPELSEPTDLSSSIRSLGVTLRPGGEGEVPYFIAINMERCIVEIVNRECNKVPAAGGALFLYDNVIFNSAPHGNGKMCSPASPYEMEPNMAMSNWCSCR